MACVHVPRMQLAFIATAVLVTTMYLSSVVTITVAGSKTGSSTDFTTDRTQIYSRAKPAKTQIMKAESSNHLSAAETETRKNFDSTEAVSYTHLTLPTRRTV